MSGGSSRYDHISEGLDFELGHFMEMVEISKTVCTVKNDTVRHTFVFDFELMTIF